MSVPISPLAMLATSMQTQPGVYALLLGSGVSTGAGIPTGWGVVIELVRRIAAVEDPSFSDSTPSGLEKWWLDHHGSKLGYSSLLEKLAPKAATRQGLLAEFFEPSDDEREEGIKIPSRGHLAIAELVKRGSIKVIITTNFDRLIEQALETAGVAAQVIASPEAVRGMTPLTHSPVTVIKVHGDYLDLGSRNTPSELEEYPEAWNTLLSRVFDEHGLIVSGWSAEWDTALVRLIEAAPNRRYPLYWDSRSSKGTNAKRLLATRSGQMIPSAGADEMFPELVSALEALDRMAEPELTTAMAVSKLKRYLPDPVHRIDLHDLVMDATDRVVEGIRNQPLTLPDFSSSKYQNVLENQRENAIPLMTLLVTGVWHDPEGQHDQLWMDVLERLLSASVRPPLGVPAQEILQKSRMYPPLLLQSAIGVVATLRSREELFIKLATKVTRTITAGTKIRVAACQIIHPYRVLPDEAVSQMPRWNGGRPAYLQSRLLKEDLRGIFEDLIPEDEDYVDAFHGYEYRLSLLHRQTSESYFDGYMAMGGEYVGETGWSLEDRNVPLMEVAFRDAEERAVSWPWYQVLGGENYRRTLVEHRSVLQEFKRHRMH